MPEWQGHWSRAKFMAVTSPVLVRCRCRRSVQLEDTRHLAGIEVSAGDPAMPDDTRSLYSLQSKNCRSKSHHSSKVTASACNHRPGGGVSCELCQLTRLTSPAFPAVVGPLHPSSPFGSSLCYLACYPATMSGLSSISVNIQLSLARGRRCSPLGSLHQ